MFVSVLVSGSSCMRRAGCTFGRSESKVAEGLFVFAADQIYGKSCTGLSQHRSGQSMCHGSSESLQSFYKVSNYTSGFTD